MVYYQGNRQKGAIKLKRQSIYDHEELAIRWRKSKRTIENYRYSIKKDGLPFYKINGSVRYDLNDIIKYELDNYFGELTSA